MMSIKTVNALSHYTDWTVGHVHSGALGWVGLIAMGALYYLIPRLFGRKKMYSVRAIELHFWIATIGIVLYIAAMWIAGVMQGLMWRAVNPDGTLVYSFVESVKATYPVLRDAPGRRPAVPERHADHGLERGDDGAQRQGRRSADPGRRRGARLTEQEHKKWQTRTSPLGHEKIETSNFLMIVLILLAVAVGGIVEIVPLFFQRSTTQPVEGLKPYTRAAAGGPRHLHPRGLLQLPLADGAAVPRRDAALRAATRWPASSSTTTRSSGAASAPAPTCTAWAASTATSGTAST